MSRVYPLPPTPGKLSRRANPNIDATVPVENATLRFAALRAAEVPAELHIFEEGGHGFALRFTQDKPVAAWPDPMLAWANRHGFSAPLRSNP